MFLENGGGCLARDASVELSPRERDRLFEAVIPLETRRAILDALAQKAMEGDVRVAAFLFDRLYGRPGAARSEPGEARDSEGHDLSRLDDMELEHLACLLEKCAVRDGLPSDLEEGGR